MELRIWVDESDLPKRGGEENETTEELVLRDIASVIEEWYARNYDGIIEYEVVET